MPEIRTKDRSSIGLALGGGAARGAAHVGVLRALSEKGIEPDIICGTSIGALVGAMYLADKLSWLESWAKELTRRKVLLYSDFNLLTGGGLLQGKKLMQILAEQLGDMDIQDLPRPFAAVATDIFSGREIWFRKGNLLRAIRASIAIPGLFTPIEEQGTWLVDGGLVNPVPVSLCRALEAHIVIAVNVNSGLLRRGGCNSRQDRDQELENETEATLLNRISTGFKEKAWPFAHREEQEQDAAPSIFNILAGSLNIMQDRIIRSRMAGDPPDILLSPRVAQIGVLEFERSTEGIAEGRSCVERLNSAIKDVLQI